MSKLCFVKYSEMQSDLCKMALFQHRAAPAPVPVPVRRAHVLRTRGYSNSGFMRGSRPSPP
jgi:hypothetical protein